MPAPGSNRTARTTATTKTPSAATSATCLAAAPRRKISETAPTTGIRASTVRIGKSMFGASAQPAQDEHRADQRRANHHGEGLAAHEAVLCSPQPGRYAADRSSSPVHRSVDAVVLQAKQAGGQALTR